jgi:hypothetical protein
MAMSFQGRLIRRNIIGMFVAEGPILAVLKTGGRGARPGIPTVLIEAEVRKAWFVVQATESPRS